MSSEPILLLPALTWLILGDFFKLQKWEEGGRTASHIISTTIGGKNGHPKQVSSLFARAGVWQIVSVLRAVVSLIVVTVDAFCRHIVNKILNVHVPGKFLVVV